MSIFKSSNIEVMITETQIKDRIVEMGKMITRDFQGEDVIVLFILKGSIIFGSDLIRQIDLPTSIEFITLSSYGDHTESSGRVDIIKDLDMDINGKNVLIVEDIVDSGLTLKTLMDRLSEFKPKKLKLASLLFKPSKLKHPVKIDYLGFEIPDKFVIGYGLDLAQKYRNLPYIGIFHG